MAAGWQKWILQKFKTVPLQAGQAAWNPPDEEAVQAWCASIKLPCTTRSVMT